MANEQRWSLDIQSQHVRRQAVYACRDIGSQTVWSAVCQTTTVIYTMSQKKICRLFCFCNNLVECQPIRVIFGTAEYISNSRTYVLPTAPNVCFYTTLPKKYQIFIFCAQFMVAARLQNLVRFQDDSSSWVVKSRRDCLLSMAVVVVAGMQLQL